MRWMYDWANKALIISIGMVVAFDIGLPVSSVAATSQELSSQEIGKAVVRRLTPDQYRAIIAEVFGRAIDPGGRFDPDLRVDDLIEIGTGRVSVSSEGMAQFDIMARNIASQVTSERFRYTMIPCVPRSVAEPDDACASQFLIKVGRLIFRRPLTKAEQRRHVDAANVGAKITDDFYAGLALSLGAMLESPQFLFRQVTVEADPNWRGQYRLDAYSKASRLSFFLWNSMPDEVLLNAAEKGELHTQRGLARQISRMVASPRLEDGVRAFFTDIFHFDEMPSLAKDTTLYPKFDSTVAVDAREQTLRTLVDLLVTRHGDYRDVFTTRRTFLTQALASIYDVPLVNDVPNGSPDTWQAFEFSSDDVRAGILTHLSFVALHSHAGRSSPTLRGKALREIVMCQKVPLPPGDISFELIADTANPLYKTTRERLTAHATEPMCAGCHKITDPIGLVLENFDASGAYRQVENGVHIDVSGALDGRPLEGAADLGEMVGENPAVTSCLVDRLFAYALGRTPVAGELPWIGKSKQTFEKDGYVIPELMHKIAVSPEFYRVPPPPN